MRRVQYDRIAPADSFIGQYLQMCEASESPTCYDFWCALWLLSGAVGRRVHVARPSAPVHLNWYVVLVADSGVTRKSSAVRTATSLVKRLHEGLQHKPLLVESKTTPEALELQMANASLKCGQACAAIAVSEMATVFGKEKYSATLPTLLTDLYDCPDHRTGAGTVSRGMVEMENVYVTLLTATTPVWLLRTCNPDVVAGGFTSRCMFVLGEKRKKRVAWPEPLADAEQRKKRLVRMLMDIAETGKKRHRLSLTPSARGVYERWYNSKPESGDPFNMSFESREDDHLLRLAACLCINDGSWKINQAHIRTAVRVLREIKEDGSKLFGGNTGQDKLLAGVDKVLAELADAGLGGIRRAVLYRRVHHLIDAKTLDTVINVLHELDMIQVFQKKASHNARKTSKFYRVTEHLWDKELQHMLLRKLEPQA